MAIVLRYEVTSDLVTKRTHGRIMRRVWRTLLLRHRDHRLGKHFREIPETRPGGGYGYERRNPDYEHRKLRSKGHKRPLVWSGRLMRFVRNSAKITVTQKGGRLRTPALRQRRRAFVAQYVRELEAVTRAEEREITQGAERLYLREAAKPENRRRRTRSV